jgi:hypothetical protein
MLKRLFCKHEEVKKIFFYRMYRYEFSNDYCISTNFYSKCKNCNKEKIIIFEERSFRLKSDAIQYIQFLQEKGYVSKVEYELQRYRD